MIGTAFGIRCHVRTSRTCPAPSGGWHAMQRQPFGLSASHHQDAPRQHRHRAPGVGWIVGSAQLTGRSCGTAAAGFPCSPSATMAARSAAMNAASSSASASSSAARSSRRARGSAISAGSTRLACCTTGRCSPQPHLRPGDAEPGSKGEVERAALIVPPRRAHSLHPPASIRYSLLRCILQVKSPNLAPLPNRYGPLPDQLRWRFRFPLVANR